MEPNTESLWQLNKIVEIDTEGYCRDVNVSGDSVFLATGQAGIQLWVISNITSPILVWKKTLSDLGVNKEISQVEYKPSIKQLFALESNERPIHIDLSKSDSVRTDPSSKSTLGTVISVFLFISIVAPNAGKLPEVNCIELLLGNV